MKTQQDQASILRSSRSHRQVARERQAADASCLQPMLSLEEKALLAEKYAKKRVDSQKRGIAVMLRDIMAHKVGRSFET